MVTLSRNPSLQCDVPPETALRVRERIRPLYRESLGGFANPSAGHSLPSRGEWNFNQTLDSGPSVGNSNHADTDASRISYVWGPDLGSGTDGHASWQKAGGVRGLLAVLGMTDNLKQFPLMDRLGNVTGYKKASVSPGPAVLDAVIEYDAFGREVRSTGPASDTMPFRFSTKYTDPESGLVYYGYRFYDPDRGRWVNRDSMGERGGENCYAILKNQNLLAADYLGLVDTATLPSVTIPQQLPGVPPEDWRPGEPVHWVTPPILDGCSCIATYEWKSKPCQNCDLAGEVQMGKSFQKSCADACQGAAADAKNRGKAFGGGSCILEFKK